MNIPKIIHQTWKTSNLDNVPLFKFCQSEWLALHPSFEYKLHTDKDLRNIVEEYAPEYLSFFDSLTAHIEKVDFFRYALLYGQGGIYADMDMYPLKSFDVFLTRDNVTLGKEPPEHTVTISNALMISPPGHVFWKDLMEYIKNHYNKLANPVDTTGPGIFDDLKRDNSAAYNNVVILEPNVFFPMTNRYTHNTLSILTFNPNNQEYAKKTFNFISDSVKNLNDTYALHLWSNSWTKDPKMLFDSIEENYIITDKDFITCTLAKNEYNHILMYGLCSIIIVLILLLIFT